jgi:hypothetical protein
MYLTTLISKSEGNTNGFQIFAMTTLAESSRNIFVWFFRVLHGTLYRLLTLYCDHQSFINRNASFTLSTVNVLVYAFGFGAIF